MAGESIIHGKVGILSIWDTSAYKPIACLTSNSLATSLSVIESNTKCDPGNTVRNADQFSYDISADGEYIDTTSVGGETTLASHDWLLVKQMAKTNVSWKLDSGLADTVYYGAAIISDLNLDQPSDANSTFSCTLSGSGAIVTTDPNA
jgi:predicted secreted protein